MAFETLLRLKAELKNELSSSDISEQRLVGLLEQIDNHVSSVPRDKFVESMIGGHVKKVSETQIANRAGELALALMNKWKANLSK